MSPKTKRKSRKTGSAFPGVENLDRKVRVALRLNSGTTVYIDPKTESDPIADRDLAGNPQFQKLLDKGVVRRGSTEPPPRSRRKASKRSARKKMRSGAKRKVTRSRRTTSAKPAKSKSRSRGES